MTTRMYVINTLSNMHVGSGEVNYGVIDNLIQRDSVTNLPNINSSGLKGAIREYFKENENLVRELFGSAPKDEKTLPGKVRFFEANLLSMPVRSDKVPFLMVSAFLHFPPFATLCKPTTCEILFRETNPKRDKNGTKSQENKIKNASSPTSLVVDFSFLCKGTILSREKQAKSSKYAAYQTFILHVHFQEDTASASCTDLCCLLQRPVKIRFMPFVHYGIAADAHCLGTVYNPSAIICNAEICVPSANW